MATSYDFSRPRVCKNGKSLDKYSLAIFDFDISDIWLNASDFEYPCNYININPLKN